MQHGQSALCSLLWDAIDGILRSRSLGPTRKMVDVVGNRNRNHRVSFKSWCCHLFPAVALVLLSYLWSQAPNYDSGPVVAVEQGRVRGVTLNMLRDYGEKRSQQYHAFKGVPYAKPPLGPLRFRAPQPLENWTDIRLAIEEGHMCCQPHTEIYWMPPEINKWFLPSSWRRAWNILYSLPVIASQIMHFWDQQEDCLYLNIYTKELPSLDSQSELSPVVVFIHGGAFYTGTANSHIYGPDYLLREDVVLVTIQYRLGALGFLAPGDSDEVPGNAGLKDQAAALRWLQRNVARFGGDPGRVTLLGHSAGGASVHYHMLSPQSRGLFHSAIMLSGSAMHPWAYADPASARRRAFKLGTLLGFNGTSSAQLVGFLRKRSPKELIQASYSVFTKREHGRGLIAPFVPTVETGDLDYLAAWNETENPAVEVRERVFLRKSPQEAMQSPDFRPVPTIVGQNSAEGILVMLPDIITEEMTASKLNMQLLEVDFERAVPEVLGVPPRTPGARMLARMMREHYFHDGLVLMQLENYLNMFGDMIFGVGMGRFAMAMMEKSTFPVYLYLFSFDGRLSVLKKLTRMEVPGVSHGDELGYIFPIEMLPADDVRPGDIDITVRDRWIRFIVNFAKTRDPTPDDDPTFNRTRWRASSREQPCYLDMDADLSMCDGFPGEDPYRFYLEMQRVIDNSRTDDKISESSHGKSSP